MEETKGVPMLRWIRFLVAAVVVLALGIPATAESDEELPPGGTFVDDDGDVHEGYIEAIAADRITRWV